MLLFVLCLSLIASIHSRTLNIGDLSISNDLKFNELESTDLIKTKNLLTSSISANSLQSNTLDIQSMYVEEITNPNGPIITIEGGLNVRGSISWSPDAPPTGSGAGKGNSGSPVSLLQVDSVVVNGVKQWSLLDHENFDAGNTNGWKIRNRDGFTEGTSNTPILSEVHGAADSGIFTSYSNILYKSFENIPSHFSLMIEGQILLKPSDWSGQALYVKANGKIAWLEHVDLEHLHNSEDTENNWETVPMAFILNHEGDSLLLEIGTMNSMKDGSESAGFGLDDFVLHAR